MPQGNELTAGGMQRPGQDDELREQRLDLKNALPLEIYFGMEYASKIQSALPYGQSIQPRHIKGFYQTFWHIYHFVRNSVDAESLTGKLTGYIDSWFKEMQGHSKNTDLLLLGIDLFLEFVKNMQTWGIGQLFEKGIDPPFMSESEDQDIFEMLLEQEEEFVVGEVGAEDV